MPDIKKLIKKAEKLQKESLILIPSENYTSKAVRDAVGSMLANKYSEGYPGKRYYQGNQVIDQIESIAINQAKKIFNVEHVNVQVMSGSIANAAAYFGLLDPGDKIMGLELKAGGHLTHGHPKITFSGKFYNSVQFDLGDDNRIDYQKLSRLAKQEKPKLILIGPTAYPFIVDWERIGKIADSINAWFVADISHVAGLIIGGVYPSPAKHAHVITTTTHKTLRGPKGAMIMTTAKGLIKNSELDKIIDKAVFPGLQGGPHNGTIAGIAQCLQEAGTPQFKKYAQDVVKNAQILATELQKYNLKLVGGGTDSHLMLIDLTPLKLSANEVCLALEKAHIITNKNTIPSDPGTAANPSGIRLGTPAVTTRGMKAAQMKIIPRLISEIIHDHTNLQKINIIKREVVLLCKTFPLK